MDAEVIFRLVLIGIACAGAALSVAHAHIIGDRTAPLRCAVAVLLLVTAVVYGARASGYLDAEVYGSVFRGVQVVLFFAAFILLPLAQITAARRAVCRLEALTPPVTDGV